MGRQLRRLLVALALALASGLVLVGTAELGLFTTWQAQSGDFLFKAKSGEAASRIGMVAIDDRSIEELAPEGRLFNWPRSFYTQVITALAEAGARVIALDVLFDTPSPDDAALARAIAAAGNVVLPVAGEMPAANRPDTPLAYGAGLAPLPELAQAAAALGHANVHPDADGTVRRQQLVITVKGQELPALALAASARYLRRPNALEGPARDGALPFAGRAIPISDRHRGMLINYLGGPYQDARGARIPVVSFVDALRGRADLRPLRDRVVVVGLVAAGFADDYWTPPSIGRKMPGVEVHAHAVETILQATFLRPPASLATSVSVLLLALAAGLGAARLRIVQAALLTLGLVLGYFLVAFVLFDAGLALSLAFPPVAPLLSFAVVTIYRVLFVEADQRTTRRLLSGYLSPAVMLEVTRDPERLRLGGDRRNMTVLFSDIRGFTPYSERVPPEVLIPLLNEYLTAMTAVIFRHQGVVDKYMGDGIMAFWGAPVAQPDHARLACLAAIGMIQRLDELRVDWQARGIPPFRIGIGIHTGDMSVGNMGSQERFSYTVIGDAVNLAARLEGLNKLYGTDAVVSEATRQAAGDGFECRPLDLVAVKGKSEPVAVHELLPPLPAEDPAGRAARTALLERYAAGQRLASERRWDEAEALFRSLVAEWPTDGPSAFHAERCAELAASPPAADWDGVYVAKTK